METAITLKGRIRANSKWIEQAAAYRKAWLRYESAALHAGQEVAS